MELVLLAGGDANRMGTGSPDTLDLVSLQEGLEISNVSSSYRVSSPSSSYQVSTPYGSSSERSMRRKALNRACKLGQLYSGIRDEIMPEFMLGGEVPEEALVSVDMKQTYLTWDEEFATEDRFRSLEVEGELKLSVMLGLADVKGASKYIASAKKSSTCVRICMVYRVITKEETLNLQHDEVAKMFKLEALEDSPATHVIIGIQWGYSGVIVFEQGVTEYEDRGTVEASLKATLKSGLGMSMLGDTLSSKLSPVKLGGGFTPKLIDNDDENLKKRSVKIIADIMPPTAIEPNDFASAIEFARSVGDMQHIDVNGGRGKPQEIGLLSVEAVCKRLRGTVPMRAAILRTLSKNIMIAVEKELERLTDTVHVITLMSEDLERKAKKMGVLENVIAEIEAMRTNVGIESTRFCEEMRELLVEVRSGMKPESAIAAYLREFQSTKYSAAGLTEQVKVLKALEDDVDFLESMKERGVEILSDDTSPDSLVADSFGVSSLYILCYDDKHRLQRSSIWLSNHKLFQDLVDRAEDDNSKLFLLDYARCKSWDRGQDVCIMLYRGGLWNPDYLTTVNSSGLSSNEMNILLLGQTGVGKSTFINAFYNYLSYDSLQEGEKGGVKVAIPSQFVETDHSMNEKIVTVGDNSLEDENFDDPSQSSTQRCKSYLFNIEPESNRRGIAVRLIDTPGIGDTRGEAWDKKNFNNILMELKKYTHIHGVCIFLKPNESRLNIMLEYCITELLVHLHKNSSRNMAFCFTSAKSTNFHVGDTLKPLRALLDNIQRKKQVRIPIAESTMYCFDNEAFRYLAAREEELQRKDNIRPRPPIRSWSHSTNECVRLLSQFNSVGPHLIEETVSIIRVKNIIQSLEEPMMKLAEQINENSALITQKRKEVEDTEEDLEKLEKVLMKATKILASNIRKLDHAKTVCTSAKCTTTIALKDGRTEEKHRVCHDKCTGHETSWKVLERMWVRLCSSMVGGKCIHCQCPARYHKFVTYEIVDTMDDLSEDSEQGKLFKEGKSAAVVKKLVLKWYEKKVQALEKEKKYINDAQMKFAFFLQEDSLTSTNDYKSKYLDREILQLQNKLRNEKGMDEKTRTKFLAQLELLKSRSQKYKKELREFAEFLKKEKQNSGEVSLENIKALLEGLEKLPNCGPIFAAKLAMDESDQQLDDSSIDFQIVFEDDRDAGSSTSLSACLLRMALHRQHTYRN